MTLELLSQDFLDKYEDFPSHMNELGTFVFYRTYSRWLPKLNRRETWKEAVARAVNYNVNISIDELKRKKMKPPVEHIRIEAETLFDNIYNLRQFLSGRTHWVGGAESKVADKFPLANFNCSFINIRSWEDLSELFYLLMVGTGVGIKCTKAFARELAPLRDNFTLTHREYVGTPKEHRKEHTSVNAWGTEAIITIGDSKEGWVQALRSFFDILINHQQVTNIVMDYNNIRPRGERLVTFGGTASGFEPMKDMFIGIEQTLKGTLDDTIAPPTRLAEGKIAVRPIHILDMCNLIGNNVVVGGRR